MADKKFKGVAQDFIKAMKLSFIGKGAESKDIFVQDLYNLETSKPINKDVNSLLNNVEKYTNLSLEDRKTLEAILKIYNQEITTKRELLEQSRRLFESDIIQTVIDVMIDDGFNSFNDEKNEFKIEYNLDEEEKDLLGEDYQKNIQNEIDEFVETFHIKSKVAELCPEILRDGEYAFGVIYDEQNKKGITEIVDDLDVINMLPFYEGDSLSFVMNQPQYDDKNNMNTNMFLNKEQMPKIYKPDNIVFFRLKGPTKKRINLSTFYDNETRQKFLDTTGIKLPKYIRVPLPIYYSAIKNLNRLEIMENVATVLGLSDLLKPDIVHVSVPNTTNEKEANFICRNYERHLNDNSGLTDSDSLTDISTLTTQANRRKVLPQWSDGKGSIQPIGIGNDSDKGTSAWDTASRLRDLIALSIGIPPFYLNMSQSPQDKAQILKLYSRYTRKLTSLQKTLADGVRDLICLHLEKKGINITKENIVIKFKAITTGDTLDDTDMMVATISGINDLYKGLEEIINSENNNFVLDEDQFKEFFDNRTSQFLNISNLLKKSDVKFNQEEFNGQDGGFEPSSGPSGSSFEGGSDLETGEDIDSGFEEAGIDADNAAAYDDFANASDNIELEGPQEIETEG